MTSHVDASAMSAYAEGLLRPRKRAKVASHLAACAACAQTLEQLSGVREVLAAAPAPAMPAGLAARLDAALAAEMARPHPEGKAAAIQPPATSGAAGASGRAGASGAAPPSPGSAQPGRSRGARRARQGPAGFPLTARLVTAGAAALALLGGGGYAVSQAMLSAPRATAGGSAAVPARRSPSPGAALGARNGLYQGARTAPVIASGTRYQPGALASQALTVLAHFSAPDRSAPGGPYLPSATAHGLQAQAFSACVAAVARGQRVLLVDLAEYAGRPAAVIVTRGAAGRAVWVVPRGCTARHADVIARATLPG